MELTSPQNQDYMRTSDTCYNQLPEYGCSEPPYSAPLCWPQAYSDLDNINAFAFDLPIQQSHSSPETDWSHTSPDTDRNRPTDWSQLSPDTDWYGLTDWNCLSSESDWLTDSPPHSLSPASPESCRCSPPSLPRQTLGVSHTNRSPAAPTRDRQDKRSRWRCAGRQRQSASEREKLRMRGLATALHNLRMYLPPSVAAPDQSLTKLQTLRLTIRYIAHLTKLLGLSDRDELLGLSEGKSLHHHALPSLPTGHSLSHHRQEPPLTLSPLQKAGCEMEATGSWTLTGTSCPALTGTSYSALIGTSCPALTGTSYLALTGTSYPALTGTSYPALTGTSYPALAGTAYPALAGTAH
eukprot:gi/632979598/ref/XP_007906558.1/ PREDICTED: uncharacterized protein LOC103188387 [Callorhinchus milii]